MYKLQRLFWFASAPIACIVVVPALASGPSGSSSGVIPALEKKYVVTNTTPDFEQITKDGTTMAMKCAGVYSIPSNLMIKPDNKVVEGKVQTPGMMVRVMWTKSGAHVLQTGDKVYITKMENKAEGSDDVLRFTLLTVDALDVSGSASKKKYDAIVSFRFKKGYLEETAPEEVEQAIEAVLAPDTSSDDAKGGDSKGGEQAQAQQPPAKPAPAAPRAAPAAPAVAPAPAAPAPTISIGESSTEVLQAMGMPLQMIDLGKKKTFVYKDMKIIFLNDKVSDMQ